MTLVSLILCTANTDLTVGSSLLLRLQTRKNRFCSLRKSSLEKSKILHPIKAFCLMRRVYDFSANKSTQSKSSFRKKQTDYTRARFWSTEDALEICLLRNSRKNCKRLRSTGKKSLRGTHRKKCTIHSFQHQGRKKTNTFWWLRVLKKLLRSTQIKIQTRWRVRSKVSWRRIVG